MSSDYNFNFEILEEKISLLYFPKYSYDEVMYSILKSVLFNPNNIFFSLTCNEDEISLFIDSRYEPKNNYGTIDKGYRVIRIYDNYDGVENIGIVSKISGLLSEKQIPILYVNSYNNNYILIKEKYLEKTKEVLEKLI
jgi:hypothetical protein